MEEKALYVADPRAGYLQLKQEIDAAIQGVLDGPVYILGETVSRFEAAFAAYIGAGYGVGVNNGTDAIHLALRGLGIGPGDEVITVSHTAVATVAAVVMAGATPVLADVDPATYTISPGAAAELITARTKAIIAVHLYGHPADLNALGALCERRGLKLVEDCAQAHGARYHGRRVGSFGHVSTFSFYPTKNLGAIGDGGMMLTSDPELARRLRLLRQYGWDTPQNSLIQGWNSRLDPMQAAILEVKLKHLDAHTARRRELARAYTSAFADLPFACPLEADGREHVHHLYVIRVPQRAVRDALRTHLLNANIHAGIHYPHPVHQQPAYEGHLRTGDMSVTEDAAVTVLSLPLYPELSDADQQRVIQTVRAYFNSAS
ncbi:MAG: DegT/DnrJ/EryC1/StrS family aminotransferase [Flavobacteriales bacterium]|nr:DegT/DnrJ/EryC1/StrS family aminotransferase [Flavobacteriales bacterium]